MAAAVVVALLVIRFGPVMNPPSPIAAAAEGDLRTELIWPEAVGISPQGDVSPDGRWMTYVDWLDQGNLAVRDLTTGENRRLTTDGKNGPNYANESSISPDGGQVVYSWAASWGEEGETTELRMVSLDDGAHKRRTIWSPAKGTSASVQDWFPDGKRVAVVVSTDRSTHQIAAVSVAEGAVEQIRSLPWSQWPRVRVSPGGKYLAYSRSVSKDEPARDIFVVATDGSKESVVVEHAADDQLLGWGPKGDYLLINSNRGGQMGVWIQPLDGMKASGEPRILLSSLDATRGMCTVRNGTLYYPATVSRRRLKIASLDMGAGKFLSAPKNASERFLGRNSGPSFSLDGNSLAYRSEQGDNWNQHQIVISELATGDVRTVPHNFSRIGRPKWVAGQDKLFVSARDAQERSGIFYVDPDDGTATPLARPEVPTFLTPTRDGKRLLYRTSAADETKLYVFDLALGKESVLPGDFGGQNGGGRFDESPDGKQIATIHNRNEIRIHPMDGGEGRTLWRVDGDNELGRWLVWTPDGRALLILRRDQNAGEGMWRLWIVPTDGSDPYPTELVHDPANYGAIPLAVHPDGKQIAYAEGGYFFQIWALRNLDQIQQLASAE
jgi:Tol biopolymer transport system component